MMIKIFRIGLVLSFALGCTLHRTALQEGPHFPGSTLEVITCNTGDLGGHRRLDTHALAMFLSSLGQPDVLLLQEIRGEKESNGLASVLGLPHALFLKSRLGKNGVAMLSRYPLTSPDHLYFKMSPRGYGALSADMVIHDKKIRLVSVHLDRVENVEVEAGSVVSTPKAAWRFFKQEVMSDTVRSASAKALVAWLGRKPTAYTVIGGDFNTVPFSKTIGIMTKEYDDVMPWRLFQGTYTRLGSVIPARIDFLFHSPELNCKAAEIIQKSPGDHFPVVARFQLP